MARQAVNISMRRLHCADCVATLTEVVLPRLEGVYSAESNGEGVIVEIDDETLSESDLIARLIESGLVVE